VDSGVSVYSFPVSGDVATDRPVRCQFFWGKGDEDYDVGGGQRIKQETD